MKKVLIVDDDQYIREIYQEVLIGDGYEVETAIDGKKGLEKILDGGFDLILLDVMLPYIDGIGILKEISDKKTKLKNGPIILLTNLVQDVVTKEALENGAKECFNKAEMNPGEFLKKVNQILKKN